MNSKSDFTKKKSTKKIRGLSRSMCEPPRSSTSARLPVGWGLVMSDDHSPQKNAWKLRVHHVRVVVRRGGWTREGLTGMNADLLMLNACYMLQFFVSCKPPMNFQAPSWT
jgi:hypothetical protein